MLRALGAAEIETEKRVCPGCWHVSRLPRYDERKLHGEKGTRIRREIFERRFPGKAFRGDDGRSTRDQSRRLSGLFLFASRLHRVSRQPGLASAGAPGIGILDWGGGDGFLGEAISLVSAAALGIECCSCCHDLSTWETAGGPRVRYVSAEDVDADGPYDVLLLSHVLEHVAFPVEVLRGAAPSRALGLPDRRGAVRAA